MSKRATEIWTMQEINDALQNLEHGEKKIVIPRFQRGQRWDPKQEESFIDSVRKGFPVGTLLFYKTFEQMDNRGLKEVYTLVDGLQRSTAIYRYMQAPMKYFSEIDISSEQFRVKPKKPAEKGTFECLFSCIKFAVFMTLRI